MVRVKSRYLLCEINISVPSNRLLLEDKPIFSAVKDAVASMHGDYGAAQCSIGFSVKYVNALTGIMLIRCPKSSYRLIWSALPFVTSVEHKGRKIPFFLNCLHVGVAGGGELHSGTIRTCQKFLVRYNTQQLHRMLPQCKTTDEKTHVRRAILSSSTKMLKGKEHKEERD
ncbi:ribonuclease P/MRP protein subunit POP5 isoform X1 [Gadus macrocephalus]|uniref:ribonuclease P/MRP protein subunit POP5 isoform X1 n=1 Tax=Gadus macrocephalus TaxID=80720 RepID=UPI0028CB8AAD|nr:ribonuclease P/MRP protein subunit POP5 isoform X1 [Gadus macrocephalus]